MKNIFRPPFIHARDSIQTVTLDVLAATVPALIWSVYVFGARAAVILLIAVFIALLTEFLYSKCVVKENTAGDLTAVITGILIAFALPASVPYWVPAFASFVGILFGKQIFGGIGRNIFNPAAVGICASYFLFRDAMTLYTAPFTKLSALAVSIPEATLASAKAETALGLLSNDTVVTSSINDYLLGSSAGGLGEVSVVMLGIGLLYLLCRRTIRFNAPFAYLMTIVVLTFFTSYADCEPVDFMQVQVYSGGIALIAVFCLNDYATTPSTRAGHLIFGILLGALTVGLRYYGMTYYGEYFAVLILNALTPVLEKLTYPHVFGSAIGNEKFE